MFNAGTLIASVIWSAIGLGFAIYGKRQGAMVPLIGGVLLIAISYLVPSAGWMSVTAVLILAAIFWLRDWF